jgi:hypothetical protein
MKYLFITLIFFTASEHTYAQLKKYPTLNIGVAKRPELFELANYQVRGFKNRGFVFKGFSIMNNPCFALDLNQELNNKKWSLQLSNYFSYNYLYSPIDSNNNTIKDVSSFKYDCFIDIVYKIKLKNYNNIAFFIAAGIGRLNMSKKFSYNYPTGKFDNNGKQIFERRSNNLSLTAPRLYLGIARKKIGFFISAMGTPDEDLNPYPSLWVEYKILYNIFLKNKASK